MSSPSGLITHWGLVPGIKSLTATYDPARQVLTLCAKGSTNLITRGYRFIRDKHFVGGLAFDAKCWVGPALRDPHNFEWCDKFSIRYVPGVMPLDVVTIRTADHPEGQLVDVKWLGLKPPAPQSNTTVVPQAAPVAVQIPRPIIVHVGVGGTFEIQVASANQSNIIINFDPGLLNLKDANIIDNNLIWTFSAPVPGVTTVTVTFDEETARIGNERLWEVYIGDNINTAVASAGGSTNGSEAVLEFLGGVNIAVTEVQKQWQNATLYSVDCKQPPHPPYPVDQAYEICQLVAMFRVGSEGTVRIESKGWWSNWDAPVYTPGGIVGNNDISWPPSKETWDMGLEKAVTTLLADPQAPRTFWNCVLSEPQHPTEGPVQPTYTFLMLDASYWSVGAKDGKVWKS